MRESNDSNVVPCGHDDMAVEYRSRPYVGDDVKAGEACGSEAGIYIEPPLSYKSLDGWVTSHCSASHCGRVYSPADIGTHSR